MLGALPLAIDHLGQGVFERFFLARPADEASTGEAEVVQRGVGATVQECAELDELGHAQPGAVTDGLAGGVAEDTHQLFVRLLDDGVLGQVRFDDDT